MAVQQQLASIRFDGAGLAIGKDIPAWVPRVQSETCLVNTVLLEQLRQVHLIYVLCMAACPTKAELRSHKREPSGCKA